MTEEIDKEQLQLQKLDMLRKIVLMLVLKWSWTFVLAFLLTTAALIAVFGFRRARAWDRCEAQTSLLYSPKKAAQIASMDDRQVFHIFTRASMIRKFVDSLGLTGVERMRARMDLSITQVRGETRVFRIVAKGRTEKAAVDKANAFADLCLKEYVAYRMADLEDWQTTIVTRRKELFDQLVRLDAEEVKLTKEFGVSTPESDISRLQLTVIEQKAALSETLLKLANEELKRKKIEHALDGVNPGVLSQADVLKELQRDVLDKAKEVTRLRGLYTDLNPRLQVAMKNHADAVQRLEAALKANGLKILSAFELSRLAELSNDLKETKARAEVQTETKQALEQQIVQNEKQIRTLIDILPQFDRIKRQRDTLQSTLQGLEETISNIRYLQTTVAGDISQIERAMGAHTEPAVGKKVVVLGLLGGAFFASFVTFLFVLADFAFGKIRGAKEVAAYLGLVPLGGLPPHEKCPEGVSYKDLLDALCFRIENTPVEKGTVLVGLLPGGVLQPDLHEVFEWNLTMAGKRILKLNVVSAKEFAEPPNARLLSAVWTDGANAWFPIANAKSVSPSEMQLLTIDVAELRKTFDTILITRPEPLTGGLFARQMMKFCDSSIIYVGARQTPRRMLRRMLAVGESLGKQPMVLTTGVRNAAELQVEE